MEPTLVIELPPNEVENPFKEQAVTPAAVELSQVMFDDPTVILSAVSAFAAGLRPSINRKTAKIMPSVFLIWSILLILFPRHRS
jgi:hypothetical protein